MGGDAVVATLVLGGMCLLMWWLARLARKRMGVGAGTVSQDALRVVGKRPLDQKNALYVVEIAGGRHILVGASADGGVTKIDDITSDEYATMVAEEPATPRSRPRLRLAGAGAGPATADPAAADDQDRVEPHEVDDEQRFATVGESFGMLLGRARDARSARRERRVSGDD